MSGLSAGDLEQEITIQSVTFTADTSGDPVPTWATDEENVPAQWFPQGTREAYLSQQRQEATIDGVFRIYGRDPRPTPDRYRVIFEGRTYDITGVVEIGRNTDDTLELSVVARAE
jgi:head-tail adaptor